MLLFHQYIDYDKRPNGDAAYWSFAREIGRRLEAHGVDFQYAMQNDNGAHVPGVVINNRLWVDASGYGNIYDKPFAFTMRKEQLDDYMGRADIPADYFSFKSDVFRKAINSAIEKSMDALEHDPDIPEVVRNDSLEAQLLEAKKLGFNVINIFYHETSKKNEQKIRDEGFKLKGQSSGASDGQMPHGVFVKPSDNKIDVAENPIQIPVLLKEQQTLTFESRESIARFIKDVPALAELQQDYQDVDDKYVATYDAVDAERASAPKRGTPEAKEWRSEHFAELDRILHEWKEANLFNATLMQNAFTKELAARGVERIVVQNDEGSFGRKVTTVLSLDPDGVRPASSDFKALKAELELKNQGYVLPNGYRGINVDNTTPESPEWDHVESVAYYVDIGFGGPEGETLSSLIYDGDEPIGTAWYRINDDNTFSFDIAVKEEAQGSGIGRHMIDRVLDEFAQKKRYTPGLKASFYVINEDLADALMRRGFIIDADLSDHQFEFSVNMTEAFPASKLLERAERQYGGEFDDVYGKLAESIGEKYDFRCKYVIAGWVDKPDSEDVRPQDYDAVVDAIAELPLTEFEKSYMLARARKTRGSLPEPVNELSMRPAARR